MKYSSYKRGRILGPFRRRTLTITWERADEPDVAQFLADEEHIDRLAQTYGWIGEPLLEHVTPDTSEVNDAMD